AWVAAFASHARAGKFDSSAAPIDSPSAHPYVLEISGFQVIALVVFALLSLALGLAVGRGPLAKHLQNAQESMPGLDAISSPTLSRPSEMTPPISSSSHTTDTPGNRRLSAVTPSAVNPSAPSPDAPTDSTSLVARNTPSPPSPQPGASPTASPKSINPLSTAPPSLAPGKLPAMPLVAPRLSSLPATMLVSGPGDGTKPFRLTLPEKPVAASDSFAMTSQLSVLVCPDAGSAHKPTRVQAGQLISFFWPHYPRPGDHHASAETVKLRITVGNLGQVLDVKHLSGSHTLFLAASTAVRQWRYKPTLLNSKPVQAQHDVTIEFRPPQHSAFLPAPAPARN
ncbi:MAG: energy transducer TonB, partial [Candidatus Acidiferrum sp.]